MGLPRKFWPLAMLAAAASGWFGTGLHPVWWATWLLPTFAFIAAAGAPRWWRWLPGLLALFVSELNMWSYLGLLPPLVRLALLLIPAAVFGACTGLFGAFVVRARWRSALILPAAIWVAFEYILSRVSPHGTFFAMGYNQADVLPVVQLASLGGLSLIAAVMFSFSSGVAILAIGDPGCPRRQILTTLATIVALAGGWAAFRLQGIPADQPRLRIGLVASDRPENMQFGAPEASADILNRYLAQIPALRDRGAELIVFPEHLLAFREAAPDANASQLESALQHAADANAVTLVIGVDRRDSAGVWWNEARIYSSGTAVKSYIKRHLLPGLEDKFHPGATWTDFAIEGSPVGVAICKDLDFTATGRAYGHRGIGLLVVPAFDFEVDGWLHSRMARMRAIENGFALARSTKTGLLTIADSRGRILAEAASSSAEFATVVAACPLLLDRTIYSRFGDWCAWLSIAVCLGAISPGLRRVGTRRGTLFR